MNTYSLTAALVFAAVAASENELMFGRNLQSVAPQTNVFTENIVSEHYLSPRGTAGLIIGFASLAVFLIYAMVRIVLDEMKRHKKYSHDLAEAKNQLRTTYKVSDSDMKKIELEFVEQETRGGKKIEDSEDIGLVN